MKQIQLPLIFISIISTIFLFSSCSVNDSNNPDPTIEGFWEEAEGFNPEFLAVSADSVTRFFDTNTEGTCYGNMIVYEILELTKRDNEFHLELEVDPAYEYSAFQYSGVPESFTYRLERDDLTEMIDYGEKGDVITTIYKKSNLNISELESCES